MDFDYILIDSFDTLNYLKNNGLNKTIKILSFNPYLVLKKSDVIISPEQFLKKEYYSDLGSISKIFTGKLFEEIIRQTNNRSLGVYVSQYLITIQNILHRASIVHKIISKKKLLIIYTDYSQKGLNKKVNGDFYNLMEKYDNIFLFKLKYEGKDQYKLGRDPVIKFTTRLNFEALSSILFRLSVIVCSKVSKYWKGKKILYSHENSLLKGASFWLFLRGYFIERLPTIKFKKNKNFLEDNNYKNILFSAYEIISSYQKKILGIKNEKIARDFFYPLFKNYLNDFFIYDSFWKNDFLNGNHNKVKACLIGTPGSVAELTYLEAAKKHNIVTASFQHGISKEISGDILNIDCIYESNIVDNYFVFNKEAYNNSLESRFHYSKDYVVGLANDMKNSLRHQKYKIDTPPILYASTTLYCGNRGIPSRSGSSDLNKAKLELLIIDKVLSKIPHLVQYKPYFSKRYVGPIIELVEAEKKRNITVNYDEIDLRYIIGNSRIIITSRATSTIGWCILSNRPVIYIEGEDNRLSKTARQAFKNNLYFFDINEKNWEKKLLQLLSSPIADIEKDWNLNNKKRVSFLNNFFGSSEDSAEKKCAKIILDKISNL